jgi:hypothetical protein
MPRKVIPPALLRRIRHAYETTDTPLDTLAARAGVSRRTLLARARSAGWRMRGEMPPPPATAPKRSGGKPSVPAAGRAAAGGAAQEADGLAARMRLAARIQRSVERELDAVERALAHIAPGDGSEAERTARTLASLARTLREVVALDSQSSAETDDDDAGPRDLDEFRRELARRMDAIIARREAAPDREPDA